MRAAAFRAKISFIALTSALVGVHATASFAQDTNHASQKSQDTFEATCKALIGQAIPGVTVTAAQYLEASGQAMTAVPEHCKLNGKLNERMGIEGKKYAIGFELRLPKNWNQRFYFQGGGGTDGVLRPALGAIPAGFVPPNALSNGFAVVSTDSGHLSEAGIQGPYLFGIDPQARVDYGYNHLPTVSAAAKALIEKAYGAQPKRSYFVGCSNGGRQGMMATQRFPDLFDGVIASAPAYRVVEASLDASAQTQTLASIAPPGPNDRPLLGSALTPDELGTLGKGILKSCDGLDGLEDGMVNNVRDCKFDPTTVQCATDQSTSCLAANKVAAIKKIFAGARKQNDELLYSAWPYDPGIASPLWSMWKIGPATASPPQALNTTLIAGAISHVFMTPPQPTTDLYGFSLQLDLEAALKKTENNTAPFVESGKSIVNAASIDIDRFSKRGKLLFYHGMADAIFSPYDTIAYFKQLEQRYGKQASQFTRLYLVPGMAHCSGGPATDQFDAVSALVAWVEQDKAPDTLVAKAGANSPWPNRTRPLCPYPKQATYSGKGNSELAESFVCK
jgi:pimeloyl-ACP methyl ester carboxylesterase